MKHISIFFIWLLSFLNISSAVSQQKWKAMWISSEHAQSTTNEWQSFRKVVTIDRVPERLIARIAADSKYWLWINDEMVVFEGSLKRGPSPADTYYDEVDIAPYLKKGENTIAVLLWYFGKNGFSHLSSGRAALLFDCQGEGIEIVSDRTWQTSPNQAYMNTDAPHPNYRLPESNIRFDARREIVGWNRSSFDKNLGVAIELVPAEAAPFNKLIKRPIPLWKDSGLRDYVSVRKSSKGDTLFCALPYNCHITPYLKVEAPAGKMIEMFTDHYRGGGPENVRAEYITRDGIQEYESFGWMNGHEVRYILPEGVKVLEVKYRETGYDTDFVGSFSCNDEFYNRLWQKSARTLYVTMRDTYMDCPDRERAQWWGDEVNELGEAFYALCPKSHQLALKGIYELMNWQRPDGTIFAPVPAGNWSSELPLQMLASVGYYGFYTQYFYSANDEFVSVVYDRLHRYLHEVWQVDEDGMPVTRHGNWSWGDWGENIDLELLTASWYYLALKAEREFALMLNKQADARENEQMMQRIAENFDARFWTGSDYRTPAYQGKTDDRGQAMAVVAGLASKEKYPKIYQVLQKEWHASPYMEKYVLEALFQMGYPEYALDRMKRRYQPMVDDPYYTTLWEGWGLGPQGFGGGTGNHAWSGGPLTLLSQCVCGIRPTAPGFARFEVKPQLGTLTQASAQLMSVNGLIKADVQQEKRKIAVTVTVPEGTEAEIILPGKIESVSNFTGKWEKNRVILPAGEYVVKGKNR